MRKVEKMQVTGNRLPGRPKETLEVSTERYEKEGTKRGAGNGPKNLEKVDQRSTNSREGKGLQAKLIINEVDVYEYMGLYARMLVLFSF